VSLDHPRDLLHRRERDALGQNASPEYRFYTSGDPKLFARVATTLLRRPVREAGYVDLDAVPSR